MQQSINSIHPSIHGFVRQTIRCTLHRSRWCRAESSSPWSCPTARRRRRRAAAAPRAVSSRAVARVQAAAGTCWSCTRGTSSCLTLGPSVPTGSRTHGTSSTPPPPSRTSTTKTPPPPLPPPPNPPLPPPRPPPAAARSWPGRSRWCTSSAGSCSRRRWTTLPSTWWPGTATTRRASTTCGATAASTR